MMTTKTDPRATLAHLERDYAEKLSALEAAVQRGDVHEVMTIRGDVEITLPTEIEAARLAVLDADVTAAEAETTQAKARLAEQVNAFRDAEEQLAAAQAQLHAAAQRHQSAGAEHAAASQDHRAAVEREARVRGERDNVKARQLSEHAARLRRLAGLPDDPDHPTTTAAALPPPMVELGPGAAPQPGRAYITRTTPTQAEAAPTPKLQSRRYPPGHKVVPLDHAGK